MIYTPSPAVLPMAWQWGLLCHWCGSGDVHAGVSYPCTRRHRLRPADDGLQRRGGLGEQRPLGAEDLANGGRSTPTGSVLLLRRPPTGGVLLAATAPASPHPTEAASPLPGIPLWLGVPHIPSRPATRAAATSPASPHPIPERGGGRIAEDCITAVRAAHPSRPMPLRTTVSLPASHAPPRPSPTSSTPSGAAGSRPPRPRP